MLIISSHTSEILADTVHAEQMVYCHNGNWYCLYPATSNALQQLLARHRVCYLLRAEYRPVHWLFDYFPVSVHFVPAPLGDDSTAPTAESVPGDYPNRACDTDQHDGARVRARLGSGNGYICMGLMVDRYRSCGNLLLLHDFNGVRFSCNHPF